MGPYSNLPKLRCAKLGGATALCAFWATLESCSSGRQATSKVTVGTFCLLPRQPFARSSNFIFSGGLRSHFKDQSGCKWDVWLPRVHVRYMIDCLGASLACIRSTGLVFFADFTPHNLKAPVLRRRPKAGRAAKRSPRTCCFLGTIAHAV